MKNNLIGCLSAAVLGAAIALPAQTMAFRGGSGFGGMHGGFGGGGMHFGGGGFGGGGMRFGGGGFAGGGFRGGMVTGRSVFVPGGNRFAGAPFAGAFRGGGGMRFGGGGFGGGGFRGGMVTGRSVFVPGGTAASFAGQRFAGNRFNNFGFRNRFNNFALRNRFFFRHHHFRNFAFFGAPFFEYGAWPYDYDYTAYGGCWRQVWTSYDWRWVNVCNGYGYYGNNGY